MDFKIRSASKGIIETLREKLAELERLEAGEALTPDTHEELVDIHGFLDRLYTISLEHAGRRCIKSGLGPRPAPPARPRRHFSA